MATRAVSSRVSTGRLTERISSMQLATAVSIPRLMSMGLAPAATFFRPSLIMAWARTVAVVVPSPASSCVLVATSFRSWAPAFS